MATDDDGDDELREVEALLAELARRQRQVREDFLAAQPLDVRERLEARLDEQRPPEGRGEEFAALLLAWARQAPRYDALPLRYLLVWYAKHAHEQLRGSVPDADAVVAYLRDALRDNETQALDEALTTGWKAHPRSVVVLASRHWQRFRAWLSPEQRMRFRPYLAALLGPGLLAAPPTLGADASLPGTETAAGWAGRPLGAAGVALGVPLVVVAAWAAIRGDGRASEPARPAAEAARTTAPTGRATPRLPDPTEVVDAGPPEAPAGPLPGLASSALAWTRYATGDRRPLMTAAWSDALGLALVAGRDGAMWIARDPTSWRAVALPPTYSLLDATFADGRFVAVGTTAYGTHAGRLIVTSTDGTDWQPQRWKERSGLTAVTHGGGIWIAVGGQGAIVRSEDGLTWETMVSGTGKELMGVTYHDGTFLVTGGDGTLVRSTDGRTWDRVAVATTEDLRTPRCRATECVLTAAAPVVATGTTDGPWTIHAAPSLDDALVAIVAEHTYYVASMNRGVLRSRDGLDWVGEIPATELARPSALAWTGTWMIAVGADGSILTGAPRP